MRVPVIIRKLPKTSSLCPKRKLSCGMRSWQRRLDKRHKMMKMKKKEERFFGERYNFFQITPVLWRYSFVHLRTLAHKFSNLPLNLIFVYLFSACKETILNISIFMKHLAIKKITLNIFTGLNHMIYYRCYKFQIGIYSVSKRISDLWRYFILQHKWEVILIIILINFKSCTDMAHWLIFYLFETFFHNVEI